MEDYSKNKIKEYKYWDVYIHDVQSALGRCYVWCKREDALDLPDATEDEQRELFLILREMENVLMKAFHPDMINYPFLGNATHHLHGHIIPRYSKPVKFEGVTFTDGHWGHNYHTNREFKIASEIFKKIKEHIVSFL